MKDKNKKQRFLAAQAVIFYSNVALVTLLFVCYEFVSDRTWWGEFITIWPPMLWLAILIPTGMLCFHRKKPRQFLWLVAVVIFFQLSTIEWRPILRSSNESATDARSIRIITWNIDSGSGGMQSVLDILESKNPDIVLFQESPDRLLGAEFLKDYWADFTWLDSGDTAILSRFPLQQLNTRRVGPWQPPQIVMAELPSSQTVLLANVRLMLPSLVLNPMPASARKRLRDDHEQRLVQYENLAELLEEHKDLHDAPLILAGDFNTPENMFSLRPLESLLTDVWPQCGRGWGATMTNSFPVSRIDQCWISDGIECLGARVFAPEISDHRLLVVDIRLNQSPEQ